MKYEHGFIDALLMVESKSMQPQSMQFTNRFVIAYNNKLHVFEYMNQSNILDHGVYTSTTSDELSKWAVFDVLQAACGGQ